MSKYETYKPSGIEWIGDVPEHWEIKKLKTILLGVNSGEGISNNEVEEDGEYEIYGGNGVMGYTNKYNSEEKVLVIGRVGAKCGVTYLVNKKIWISDNALQTRTFHDYKYLYYLLDAIDFNQYASQNAQPLITGTLVKNFSIPFIKEKEEQLNIANYIDSETQKIDRLIANKKAQAEKLKELRQIEINNAVTKGLNPNSELKDSGIDWLGKIPKHWEVKRLKNLANQISEKSKEILEDDFLVALENIESNTGKFIDTASEYENNGIKFKKNNLLYNKLRPYLNKVFQADKDGICVGDIIVIECTPVLQPTFLQFRMLSDAFCSIIMASVYGAKMPRTSWQFISSLKIGFPSIAEQIEIANFIQERTESIEKLIKNIEAQVFQLQELRKIKIYEAVTGKIKVSS